jgi:hypothetical protein
MGGPLKFEPFMRSYCKQFQLGTGTTAECKACFITYFAEAEERRGEERRGEERRGEERRGEERS